MIKSEVLVKATAELTQEVTDKDLTAKQKNMKDILNEVTSNNDRRAVHGSVYAGSGQNKEEV